MKSKLLFVLLLSNLNFLLSQITDVGFQGASNVKDAYVSSYQPTTKFGGDPTLTVQHLVFGSLHLTARTFLEFDLTSVPNNSISPIPANAIVVDAKLKVWRYNGGSTSTTMEVNKVIDSWDQNTVTWSSAPNVSNFDMKTQTLSTTNGVWHEIDVTSHVQEFINYPHLNNGWRLKCENESISNGSNYRSNEYSTIFQRPWLEVSYVLPIEITLDEIIHASTSTSNDGSISINAAEGDGTYTYQWIDGATGSDISGETDSSIDGLSAGWYGVEVTDGLGNVEYMAFIVGAQCEDIDIDFQPDERFIDDAYVLSGLFEDNNYSQNSIISSSRISFLNWFTAESYLKFNIVLPDNLILNDADLTLSGSGNHNTTNDNSAYFSRVTQNWREETMTWAIKPNSSTVLYNLPSTSTSDEDLELDLSSYFQDVQQGNINNYGFRCHLINLGSVQRNREYHSSNASTSSDRPKMQFNVRAACPYRILVKSDNPGVSSNNQFQFTGVQGEYDVIARNTSNNNIESFPGLVNQQTITFSQIGTYELEVYPVGTNPFHQIKFINGGDKNKLLEIQQWGTVEWSWNSMNRAYHGCSNLDVTATDVPDLSSVNNLYMCFRSCSSLVGNSSFNNWDVDNITNFSWMFGQANSFNQDIGSWNVGNGDNFSYMFYYASMFNNGGSPSIAIWNTSSAITLRGMFRGTLFNQPLDGWDVGNVEDMAYMFMQASSFNQNIGIWNVIKVEDMSSMFREAGNFNNGNSSLISQWNTQSLKNTIYMFSYASSFNQNVGNWDMADVSNMHSMFRGATAFNNGGSGDINSWDLTNISNLNSLFREAPSFNQDVSNWDVGGVSTMNYTFKDANSFSHSLEDWDITSVTSMSYMLDNTNLSVGAYDSTLIGWENQNTQSNVTLGANNLVYCLAEPERSNLISSYNWTINGDSYSGACHKYAVPERELNSSFYETTYNRLLFVRFWEPYEPISLTYRIINSQNIDVSTGASLVNTSIENGTNLLQFNFGSNGQCLPEGYYILEIEDQKGNVRKLRFYQSNSAC